MGGLKDLLASALGRPPFIPPEEEAYRRLVKKGFEPDGIIDVGAYEGNWTRMARRVFPTVPTLMVEAQDSKKVHLEAVCADLQNVRYVSAVLSAQAGDTVSFYEMETGSSILAEQSSASRREVLLTTATLDEVAAQVPGKGLFLKIDVQGAELLVLEGGPRTLSRATVVQLEAALLPYNEGAPALIEVLSYMEDKGLYPFDISGSSRVGGHLVQIDLLFTRKDNSNLRPNFFNFKGD